MTNRFVVIDGNTCVIIEM